MNEGTHASPVAEELRLAATLTAELAASSAARGVERLARAVAGSLRAGGKVMACGNGGSAADAMHLCEELTGRYRGDRPALAALACTDPGHLTCVGNDYGFDQVFARWVKALGRPGDVLIVLSTSGKSRNILLAAEAARDLNMTRAALLGKDGGVLRGLCEHEILVPGTTADRIQELHMLLLHALIGQVERELGVA